MEDKKMSQELDEDEELASLRLAALATLKSRANENTQPVSGVGNNILPISSISRNVNHSSDKGSRTNQHSWRNNAQLSKRKGKAFPKSSQRSNLIVITPIGAEKKNTPETNSVPQLLLPQHKWCQQVNEDSSSPRTDRHTGPSRFNRRGSESESSDSEYEGSDDSYSNETVLQDEPSRLSPVQNSNDNEDNSNSECKISFNYLDNDSNLDPVNRSENNPVYNCIRTSSSCPVLENNNPNQKEIEIDNSASQNNNLNSNNYSYVSNSKSSVPDHSDSVLPADGNVSKQKSKHTPIKFDVPNSTSEKVKTNSDIDQDQKYLVSMNVFTEKTKCHNSEEKAEPKISLLSKNDLRFELKRKKANMIAFPSVNNKLLNKDQIQYKNNRVQKTFPRRSRDRSKSSDRGNYAQKRSRDRSVTPEKRKRRRDKRHYSSSRSRSSSYSSSSSSSVTSSDSSPKRNRSISSVVKPVSSNLNTEVHNAVQTSNNKNSFQLSFSKEELPLKKAKSIEIKLKPVSNFKISLTGNDSRNLGPDSKKRGPVHMRLGTLPQKRIIQMPKDVEAAFVSTSSDDEDVNNKCKKPNCMVVTDFCDKKTAGFISRPRKKSLLRSDVPKVGKGKIFR